ncbi:hypothetical protein HHI36_019092 [Cryptolaemus montrouzieri]|uniref:Uncharacterized protein n=1 Tax=Cryptolaemus montrouzieri TaxID=559131 RepID=A0ABD2P2L2_9CUCU
MEPNEEPSRRPVCRCNVDIYRKFFGPTIDESFLILFLLLMQLFLEWKENFENSIESDYEEGIQEEVQTSVPRQQRRRRRPFGYKQIKFEGIRRFIFMKRYSSYLLGEHLNGNSKRQRRN